jgi:hypothetical protein
MYPWANLALDVSLLGYDLAYLFDKTPYYRPWHKWLGLQVERRGPPDQDVSAPHQRFASPSGWAGVQYSSPQLTSTGAHIIIHRGQAASTSSSSLAPAQALSMVVLAFITSDTPFLPEWPQHSLDPRFHFAAPSTPYSPFAPPSHTAQHPACTDGRLVERERLCDNERECQD